MQPSAIDENFCWTEADPMLAMGASARLKLILCLAMVRFCWRCREVNIAGRRSCHGCYWKILLCCRNSWRWDEGWRKSLKNALVKPPWLRRNSSCWSCGVQKRRSLLQLDGVHGTLLVQSCSSRLWSFNGNREQLRKNDWNGIAREEEVTVLCCCSCSCANEDLASSSVACSESLSSTLDPNH